MKLYWVETDAHDEDWFVVAGDARQAARYHEEAEGYGPGDAMATFILEGSSRGGGYVPGRRSWGRTLLSPVRPASGR